MAHSVSLFFLSVPLYDELVGDNEVFKPHVEFFDTIVGFALLRKILHVLVGVYVGTLDGTHNSKD